jgi:hypothetical protein
VDQAVRRAFCSADCCPSGCIFLPPSSVSSIRIASTLCQIASWAWKPQGCRALRMKRLFESRLSARKSRTWKLSSVCEVGAGLREGRRDAKFRYSARLSFLARCTA